MRFGRDVVDGRPANRLGIPLSVQRIIDRICRAARASSSSPSTETCCRATSGLIPRVARRHSVSGVIRRRTPPMDRSAAPGATDQPAGSRLAVQSLLTVPPTVTVIVVPSAAGTSRRVCGKARRNVSAIA